VFKRVTIREDHISRAKLAQMTNSFNTKIKSIKTALVIDVKLTEKERDLISDGYKNAVENRRLTLRAIKSLEENIEFKYYENRIQMTKDFPTQVKENIQNNCNEIVGLLDEYMIPAGFGVF